MKLTQKQIIQTIAFFGIGLFLVYWQINQLTDEEREAAVKSIQHANYFWIFMAFGVAIFSHWLRAKRWTMLFKTAGDHVTTTNSFYAVMIGYLANGFLPRLGELIRCGVISRKEDIKFEKVVGTVLAERIFDLVVLILIVGATLLLQFDFLYGFINEKLFQPFLNSLKGLLPNMLTILGAGVLALLVLYLLWHLLIRRNTFTKKIKDKWESVRHSFMDGFETILKLKNKPLFIGYTLLMWTCYFFMSYLVIKSLDESKHLGVDAGLSVLTSGSLALIVPTPGGLGSYHEFVSRTLQLYDVSAGIGVSLSWLIWLTNFSMVLLFGFLSLLLINWSKK